MKEGRGGVRLSHTHTDGWRGAGVRAKGGQGGRVTPPGAFPPRNSQRGGEGLGGAARTPCVKSDTRSAYFRNKDHDDEVDVVEEVGVTSGGWRSRDMPELT